MRTTSIAIRVTPALKRALQDRADSESRTLSNLIEMILRNELELTKQMGLFDERG